MVVVCPDGEGGPGVGDPGTVAQPDDPQPPPGNGEEVAPRRGRPENLKPIQPGEVRNPKGINGRTARAQFAKFCEEIDPKDPDAGTRIAQVYEALFTKAKKGRDQAMKLFIEQYQGRARQHVQVTGEDDGPVRITYDDVRERVQKAAERAVAAAAAAGTEDDQDDDGDSVGDPDVRPDQDS
jgi:hypothetical protein